MRVYNSYSRDQVVVKLQGYQILVNVMRRKMIVKSFLLEGLNTGMCYHSYSNDNVVMVTMVT